MRSTADEMGVDESMVSRWVKQKDEVEKKAKVMLGKKGRGLRGRIVYSAPRGPRPRFAAAEELVRGKIVSTRMKGGVVRPATVKTWMRRFVRDTAKDDPTANAFKASSGWFADFKARYGYTTRRRTNKKSKSVFDRLPLVKKFHKTWQAEVSKPGGANDPVYGKYVPSSIFNADQSPICLQEGGSATLELRGADVVRIATKDAGDKRFATLQIMVRLDGDKAAPVAQPPITIIFKGQGKRISAEERNAWDSRVRVKFQPNAWADGQFMTEWIHDVVVPFMKEQRVETPVLFLDNLKAQATEDFRKTLTKAGILPWFFPPDCTDMVQPVDRHFAKQLKHKVSELLDSKLANDESFATEWLGLGEGTYPAWKCRVELTRCVGEAWEWLCKERDMLRLGVETGCVMYREGVERPANKCIKLDGVENYDFTDPVMEHDVGGGSTSNTTITSGASADADDVSADAEGVAHQDDVSVAASNDSDEEIAVCQMENRKAKRTRARPRRDSDCDDDVVEDAALVEAHRADDTADFPVVALPAMEGWHILERPVEMPSPSSLLRSSVLWVVEQTSNGAPGWIRSEVSGGPPDPSARARGVTMCVRCSTKLDKLTPRHFHGDDQVEVGFTVANYGTHWVMLRRADVSSSRSTSAPDVTSSRSTSAPAASM